MNASESRDGLVLKQTSLLFSYKCKLVGLEQLDLHIKISKVHLKTRSLPASMPFKGQVAEQTAVKWSIVELHHSQNSY